MPYEVSMSGGCPWGFRLAGGPFAGKPTTISRVTPGGKAGQANVMQGDVLVAINGFSISDLDLPELMEMIKISGWTLHLTLLSQEEVAEAAKHKRQSEANITNISDIERPRSRTALTPLSERHGRPSSQLRKLQNSSTKCPLISNHVMATDNHTADSKSHQVLSNSTEPKSPPYSHMPKIVIKVGRRQKSNREMAPTNLTNNCLSHSDSQRCETPVATAEDRSSVYSSSPVPPEPLPRRRKPESELEIPNEDHVEAEQNYEEEEENEMEKPKKKMPDFIRRQLKPPKPTPVFKPQVSWLHDKLRINAKSTNGISDPGNSLKVAAAAYPCQRIEIEGPVSATIVHSQYNTPVGMYSANQIVSTLVNTAAARGADVPDPNAFGDQNVDVDKTTSVYKMVHAAERSSPAPAQSRSIQILDALLEYGGEIPQRVL